MKLFPPTTARPATRRRGFSLVELLVVITIVIVLAAVTIGLTRRLQTRAESATAFNNLRQSGMILLSDAQEKNSRLEFFSGGASGGFDLRPYNIVRAYLGYDRSRWNSQPQNRIDIMHWNPTRVKPGDFHWNCYAVNFTSISRLGVTWQIDNGRPDGSNGRILSIPTVQRPEAYPILIDSSQADGREIFRVGVVATELPGLRNDGRAHAFFLDGSGRAMNKGDLKDAGFNSAYDNSTTPPKLIKL